MENETRRRLEEVRAAVENGDGLAVLYAVKICAQEEIPMPPWLARRFVDRANMVLQEKAASWDDAFGKPWPGVKLTSLRRWQRDLISVHQRIHELLAGDNPPAIDEALFERVGKPLKLGKTAVSELWYEKDSPLLRAAAKRRGDFRKNTKIGGNTRKRK